MGLGECSSTFRKRAVTVYDVENVIKGFSSKNAPGHDLIKAASGLNEELSASPSLLQAVRKI